MAEKQKQTLYVVKIRCFQSPHSEWYVGGSYTVNGEKYPVLGSKENAKRYSSMKRAERGAESIMRMNNPFIESCEIVEECDD